MKAKESYDPRRCTARGYQAASRQSRAKYWAHPSTSVNTEVANALVIARNRTREVVRNSGWAESGLKKHVARCIGTGIMARAVTRRRSLKRLIETEWRRWAGSYECDWDESMDFGEIQALCQRGVLESGGQLILRRMDQSGRIPFRLQVLEPDFIDLSKEQRSSQGRNQIRQGVEYDARGRRVAYWLFREHPGDVSIHGLRSLESRRIAKRDLVYVFQTLRAGQIHGLPMPLPILVRLLEFEKYLDATLVKQQVASMLVGFSHEMNPSEVEEPHKISTDVVEMQPGTWETLPPNRDVSVVQPPRVDEITEYAGLSLREIAAVYGVTYEALTGDFSKTNFSSGRMGWLEVQELMKQQHRIMVNRCCNRIWDWFLDGLVLGGLVDAADLESVSVTWTPVRREMIEPLREVQARKVALESRLTNLFHELRQDGHDPLEFLEEAKEAEETLRKLGLAQASEPQRRRPTEDSSNDGEGSAAGRRNGSPRRTRGKRDQLSAQLDQRERANGRSGVHERGARP